MDTKPGPSRRETAWAEPSPAGAAASRPLVRAPGTSVWKTTYFPGQQRLHLLFRVPFHDTSNKNLQTDHWPRSELRLWWQLRVTRVSGARGRRGLKAEPAVPGVGVRHWGEGPWGAWNEGPGHIWGLARSDQGTGMWALPAGSSWAQSPWDEPWGSPMSGRGS